MLHSPLLGVFYTSAFHLWPCQDELLHWDAGINISRIQKTRKTWFQRAETGPLHTSDTHPLSACLLWGTWWSGTLDKPFCASWLSRTHSMLDSCIQCYLHEGTTVRHVRFHHTSTYISNNTNTNKHLMRMKTTVFKCYTLFSLQHVEKQFYSVWSQRDEKVIWEKYLENMRNFIPILIILNTNVISVLIRLPWYLNWQCPYGWN